MSQLIDLETWLTARVASVIGVDVTEIDRHKKLDRMGLDSMSLIGLAADIERHVGQPVPPDFLAEHRTISSIAQALQQSE